MDIKTGLALLFSCCVVQAEKCGVFTCLPELNGTCEDGRCKCPGNQTGDASMDCVDPDNHCICTYRGDPHYTTYSNLEFVLPLPCAYSITQAYPMFDEYFLMVTGGATYRGRTTRVVGDRLEITVTVGNAGSIQKHVFIKRGHNPEVQEKGGETVFTVTKNGSMTVVDIPDMDSMIKYDDTNAAFSVHIPANFGTNGYSAVCGECNNDRYNKHSVLEPFDALRLQLSAFPEYTYMNNVTLNEYRQCDDIRLASLTCKQSAVAERLCGSLLLRPKLTKCLIGKLNDPVEMLNNFLLCLQTTCQSAAPLPCSNYDKYFLACDTVEVVELEDPKFCT